MTSVRTLERATDWTRRSRELVERGREAGLDACGVASAEPFADVEAILNARRDAGLAGSMQFTYRSPGRSTDPARTLPGARALVVGALGYGPVPPRAHRPDAVEMDLAAYARDDHYGRLRAALGSVAAALRDLGAAALVVADDNALVDRAAAHRSGIGGFGRNGMVFVEGLGSWCVLGSVVTDAPLVATGTPIPHAAHCGRCRACVDRCPTGAIGEDGAVDARRCLAWVLQAPGAIPEELRPAVGSRLYGCDDCQSVCPANRRMAHDGGGAPGGGVGALEVLEASDGVLLERFGRWYIAGRDPRHLRRNALVALGNAPRRSPAEQAALERFAVGGDAMLAEHARWALAHHAPDGPPGAAA